MTDKKQPTKATTSKEPKDSSSGKSQKQGLSSSFTLSSKSDSSTKSASAGNNTVHDNSVDTNKTDTNKADSTGNNKAHATAKTTAKPSKTNNKSTPVAAHTTHTGNKSKTAWLASAALVVALLACFAVGALFYWSQLENQALKRDLLEQAKSVAFDNETNVREQLNAAQQQLTLAQQHNQQQLAQLAETIPTDNQTQLEALTAELAKLRQNDPSDWLIHEAEYLARIASRTIWLEHDTKAAISLLQDADARLQEINNPDLLPIRQVIYQDIEQLKLVPRLQTEEVILQLMGLEKQVDKLSLAMVYIPKSTEMAQDFELSDNANDWRENLKKSWNRFLADFITVSRRTANVEPLMSPQHQQNLLENLRLKLQVAQWAASAEKQAVYLASLNDIALWIAEYFDMDNAINQQFANNVAQLSQEQISFEQQIKLGSIKALRDEIKAKKAYHLAPDPVIKAADEAQEKSDVKESEKQPTDQEPSPLEQGATKGATDEA